MIGILKSLSFKELDQMNSEVRLVLFPSHNRGSISEMFIFVTD